MSTKRTTRQNLLDAVRDAAERFARDQTQGNLLSLQAAAAEAASARVSSKAISDATTEGVLRAESEAPAQAAPEPKAKTSRPKRASSPKARTSRPKVARTSRPRVTTEEVRALAEDAERVAAESEMVPTKQSEAAPGTPEAVAEEAAAVVIAESPEPVLPTEIAAAAEPGAEVRVSGPEPGAGGGWENALSTKLAATRCCFCARSLRDPESIERGYGPECAEKFVMPTSMPDSLDEAAAVRALNMMPPLLRGSMERIGGKVGDPQAEWRTSPAARRQMVSTGLYIGALAVSFGADQMSVIRAKIDSSKQVLAALQQMSKAFGYSRCSERLATKYIERLEGKVIRFSRAPREGSIGVFVPYSDQWVNWCRGSRDVFTGSNGDRKNFIRYFREEKLGEVANALRGCFGDTICFDADGNMVPLPSMHIEAEPPAPAVDVTADEVEVIEEVQPYAVPEKIKLGDMVRVNGKDLRVNYINPERQFVGLGRQPDGKYEALLGFSKIKEISGREIAAELYTDVVRYTEKVGIQAPPPPTAKATSRPIPVLASGATLDPHQIEGVQFIDGRGGRVILADEMGLGKSITAVVCIDTPAVVVCPSGIKVNWMRELLKWKPGISVSIVDGTADPGEVAKQSDVVVVNYNVLDSHVGWLRARNNKTIVADEAHYLKELDIYYDEKTKTNVPYASSSKRSVAFYEIQKGVPRLLLLTGTPVMNRTRELFPLLHMVDPREWNSGYRFCIDYCGGHKDRFGFNCKGRTNSEELFSRINNKTLFRRGIDVLNLPPKRYEAIAVQLSADVRAKYEAQARDIVQWVFDNGGAEKAKSASAAKVLVQLNKLRETTAEGKAAAAVEWIKRHWTSTGRPLVVMATHKSCFARMRAGVDALNREYHQQVARGEMPDMQAPIRYNSIVGGMDNRDVAKVVDRFQGDMTNNVAPTLDLVFYSISLAIGTTLTRAQDMLFVERAWRPADLTQAEARIFRRGQTNKCLFAYLDAEGTIDQKLALLLKNKSQTIASVVYGLNLDQEEAASLILGEMFVSQKSMRQNPPSDVMDIVADGWASPF